MVLIDIIGPDDGVEKRLLSSRSPESRAGRMRDKK
jgi:hypothetical protein